MAPKQKQKITIKKVYVTFLRNCFVFIPDRNISEKWVICINLNTQILSNLKYKNTFLNMKFEIFMVHG